MSLEEELIALEHGFWEGAADPDHYREHVDEQAVFVFPPGFGVLRKEEVMAQVGASEGPWIEHRLEDVRVVPLGEGAAILVYRATARAEGEEPFSALVSSAYLERDGRWRLTFHQQSPLED